MNRGAPLGAPKNIEIFIPLRAPFDKYMRAFWTMLCGLALGFGVTAATLKSGCGFGAFRVGPWTSWPRVGGPEIDPYARAVLARRGEAPLGRDEGLVFVASADSAGGPLDGRCDYRVADPLPAARYWTLGLATASGAPLANPTDRLGYTSADILRREGGAFELVISRHARPGNWLSPGEANSFALVLRLYETPLDTAARLDPARFLKIVKLGCE
jgi:hypothetical protein